MERCPTCRANYTGGDVCHRCQTDLSQVLGVEEAAVRYRQRALAALGSRDIDKAVRYATHACELHRSPESIRALALTSLALRRFDEAVKLWSAYRESRPAEDDLP